MSLAQAALARRSTDSLKSAGLDIARLEGKTFYTEAQNHTCKNGSHILGMTKPFAGFETGDWFCGKYPDEGRSMYPSPVVARRNNEFYIKVNPQTVKVLSYAPHHHS